MYGLFLFFFSVERCVCVQAGRGAGWAMDVSNSWSRFQVAPTVVFHEVPTDVGHHMAHLSHNSPLLYGPPSRCLLKKNTTGQVVPPPTYYS